MKNLLKLFLVTAMFSALLTLKPKEAKAAYVVPNCLDAEMNCIMQVDYEAYYEFNYVGIIAHGPRAIDHIYEFSCDKVSFYGGGILESEPVVCTFSL